MIYHRGLSELLGIDQRVLENMSIRELCYRAYSMGYEIEMGQGGVGPGLTLRAREENAHESKTPGA